MDGPRRPSGRLRRSARTGTRRRRGGGAPKRAEVHHDRSADRSHGARRQHAGLGAAAVPTRYFKEFPNAYLTTLDQQDENVPWMAAQLPSLDDGTWKVREDGKMEVTWKLRPGIHWQDGEEVTAEDLQFSWDIGRDRSTL